MPDWPDWHAIGMHLLHQDQAAATAAATPSPTGGTMKLAALAHDAADSITQTKAWLGQHDAKLGLLLAEVQRLQGSVIVQALEGIVLTPEAETHIAGIITAIGAHQQQAAAASPEAEQPAEPVA